MRRSRIDRLLLPTRRPGVPASPKRAELWVLERAALQIRGRAIWQVGESRIVDQRTDTVVEDDALLNSPGARHPVEPDASIDGIGHVGRSLVLDNVRRELFERAPTCKPAASKWYASPEENSDDGCSKRSNREPPSLADRPAARPQDEVTHKAKKPHDDRGGKGICGEDGHDHVHAREAERVENR